MPFAEGETSRPGRSLGTRRLRTHPRRPPHCLPRLRRHRTAQSWVRGIECCRGCHPSCGWSCSASSSPSGCSELCVCVADTLHHRKHRCDCGSKTQRSITRTRFYTHAPADCGHGLSTVVSVSCTTTPHTHSDPPTAPPCKLDSCLGMACQR
jgi:hypothetical protein